MKRPLIRCIDCANATLLQPLRRAEDPLIAQCRACTSSQVPWHEKQVARAQQICPINQYRKK